ncbi:hypothetical protein NKH52_17765 [Mesorhizobium sp. M1066]|uniref:hypothetical protein n=1 Tax=unclassified Mesorhizobium TaxID=325217 RepID=UPI0033358C40
MTDAPKVKPVLRVIPNGIVDGHFRMTLIATPVMTADGIPLDKWPSMARQEVIRSASGKPDETNKAIFVHVASGTPRQAGGLKPATIMQDVYPEYQTRLDGAWAAIVPPNGDDLWGKLLETIHRSLASRTFLSGLDEPSPSNTVKPQAEGSYEPQKALEPGQQMKVKAVLPVKHGDLALLLEFERAKRVSDLIDGRILPRRNLLNAAFSMSDDDTSVVLGSVDAKPNEDKKTQDEYEKQVVATKLEELQAAFDALRAERDNSATDACKELRKPDLSDLAAQEETRQTALASHTAATWEQAPSDQTNTLLDRVVQCYQALVSSPAWSRFFSFAFDVQLDERDLVPDWISVGEFPIEFLLGEEKQSLGRAWMAVDADGWPRPDSSRPGLKKGLFQMGADCVAGDALPRYDLVTLDVRHATEAVVRPLAGPGADGRGFQTAGMTLVDRRRAEDVRAQIRRTSNERDKSEVELYAQDVVVGRRLDAGTKTDNGIVWRALGSKVVTYGLRRDDADGPDDFVAIDGSMADHVLQPKGASGTRTLEEAIVSPSARLTPTPGGEAIDKDVFVDEAFATWAGAPMGVDTAPKEGSDGFVLLPFLQRHFLPAAGARAEALAPPLRYGRSYRFGMRAVFLGGGSRSIEDAAVLYEDKTQVYTYPRDPSEDEQIPTRRFLRQEAICAPDILLPGSVLGVKIGEMDFGTVQSAVLRSLPEGYFAPETPPTVNGRPYVTAKDRVTPNEIIRIFTPPQAALDMLLRAGVFDDVKGRGDAALGGLRNIAFGVAQPLVKSKDAISAQGGFPIAMIDEQRAFGQNPTRRKLAPGWSVPPLEDRPAVRGATIFIGQNAFEKFGGPPLTPRPYYPDPHARQLVLRLRRRSDGAYFGSASKVPVYDEVSTYPHAMPTVVVIKKAADDSDSPGIGKATVIRTDGVSFNSKSGQRVQRVEITLARGDDFDLEAFYLPDDTDIPATLATNFAITEMIGAYKLALQRSASTAVHPVAAHITTGFFDVPSDDELTALAVQIRDFMCGEGKHLGAGGPVEELSGISSMRVAHAVNRPLVAPAFSGSVYRVYRKAFDTRHKFAIDPDLDGILPPANRDPDTKLRHQPSGLGPTEITLAELETLRSGDLTDSIGTHSCILSGRIAFDRRTTSAIEILASCISPREVLIDDPARRRPPKARVSGAWPRRTVVADDSGNPIPPVRRPAKELDVYGFEAIEVKTGAVTLHQSEVTLLRIDNIAPPGAGVLELGQEGATDTIDLSLAHIAAQIGRRVTNSAGETLFTASQLHVFPDGKARRLRLRLRAVSRFGPDFETAARWTGADGNSQPVVRLRQALIPGEQSLESAPFEPAGNISTEPTDPKPGRPGYAAADDGEVQMDGSSAIVWLPSSGRPSKCASLSPVPVFRFVPGNEGSATFTKRVSGVRIYLERGWFSSGEDERLGIVLLPSGKAAKRGDEFLPDDRHGPLGPYLTRWGGDPIRHDDAPLTTSLDAAAFTSPFGKAPKRRCNVAIPLQIPKPPGAADNVTVLEPADLLLFQPRFDIDREQWFVDLGIQAPETPNLFVRFGLVRYQEHTIHPDLRASEPVVVWSQLLPERTLTTLVEVKPPPAGSLYDPTASAKLKISATVAGASHKGRRIPQRPKEMINQGKQEGPIAELSRLHLPTVRFRLMHESGASGDLRRVTMDVGEAPLCLVQNSHAKSTWTFNVNQTDVDALGPGIVYVYAEEIETFMPATYVREPAQVEDMFKPETFVDSGPRFAARLNLRDITVAGGNYQ